MFKIAYWIIFAVLYPFYWFHVEGRENIPKGSALLCSNHSTNSDAVFLVVGNGPNGDYGFMAKDELFQIPVLRQIIRWFHAFPVKRGKGDTGAIRTGLSILKSGKKLLIFPEGTRVQNGVSVRTGLPVKAKNGAAIFSHRTGAPMIPVYITEGRKLFRKNVVRFGKPFFPSYSQAKPEAEEYSRTTAELMRRIYALKNGREGE